MFTVTVTTNASGTQTFRNVESVDRNYAGWKTALYIQGADAVTIDNDSILTFEKTPQ